MPETATGTGKYHPVTSLRFAVLDGTVGSYALNESQNPDEVEEVKELTAQSIEAASVLLRFSGMGVT